VHGAQRRSPEEDIARETATVLGQVKRELCWMGVRELPSASRALMASLWWYMIPWDLS
jgi:hypothetical protein